MCICVGALASTRLGTLFEYCLHCLQYGRSLLRDEESRNVRRSAYNADGADLRDFTSYDVRYLPDNNAQFLRGQQEPKQLSSIGLHPADQNTLTGTQNHGPSKMSTRGSPGGSSETSGGDRQRLELHVLVGYLDGDARVFYQQMAAPGGGTHYQHPLPLQKGQLTTALCRRGGGSSQIGRDNREEHSIEILLLSILLRLFLVQL